MPQGGMWSPKAMQDKRQAGRMALTPGGKESWRRKVGGAPDRCTVLRWPVGGKERMVTSL